MPADLQVEMFSTPQVLELQRRVQGTAYERNLQVRRAFCSKATLLTWYSCWQRALPLAQLRHVRWVLHPHRLSPSFPGRRCCRGQAPTHTCLCCQAVHTLHGVEFHLPVCPPASPGHPRGLHARRAALLRPVCGQHPVQHLFPPHLQAARAGRHLPRCHHHVPGVYHHVFHGSITRCVHRHVPCSS